MSEKPENDETLDASEELEGLDELLGPANEGEILFAIILAATNEEEAFGRETVLSILKGMGAEKLIDDAKAFREDSLEGDDDDVLSDTEVEDLLGMLEDEE